MQLPDPPFFTLDQVAARWGGEVDYVERFTHSGQLATVPYEAACHGCREIVCRVGGANTPLVEADKQSGVLYLKILNTRGLAGDELSSEAYRQLEAADKLEPVVVLEDLLAFERERSIRLPQQAGIPVSEWEKVMDQDHPCHAPELAAAVRAWLELYGDGDASTAKNFNAERRSKILKRLGITTNDTQKRLATVINPITNKRSAG